MDTSVPFSLALAAEGERVRIAFLRGGRTLQQRLTSMGLNIGTEIEVISRHGGGVVIARDGSRLALAGGMAHKIMVVIAHATR